MVSVVMAKEFAREKHKGQKYGEHDYFDFHVQGVVESVRDEVTSRIGVEHRTIKDLLITAYLHDVVEDTDTTIDEIKSIFGGEVADAVDALTHRDSESYQEYVKRAMENSLSGTVKFHDILFNLTQSTSEPTLTTKSSRRIKKYIKALKTFGGYNES